MTIIPCLVEGKMRGNERKILKILNFCEIKVKTNLKFSFLSSYFSHNQAETLCFNKAVITG